MTDEITQVQKNQDSKGTSWPKRLAKSAAFLCLGIAILVAFLAVSSIIVVPKDNTKEFSLNNLEANAIFAEDDQTIDVLFIGDSEAMSSFSPMKMYRSEGFTSYVCSSHKQKLSQMRIFLHKIFKHQSPQVVIIETNAIYTPFSATDSVRQVMYAVFPVLEYHNRWKTLQPQDWTGKIEYTNVSSLKGYKPSAGREKRQDESEYMIETDEVLAIPRLNQLFLDNIISFCNDKGAQVILVSTPSPLNWNYERHNGIQAYADEHNLEYIDCNLRNKSIDIDWNTDTRDKGDHLNVSGARKVTGYIEKYLIENYALPDHRGKTSYEQWDECLVEYNEHIDQMNKELNNDIADKEKPSQKKSS